MLQGGFVARCFCHSYVQGMAVYFSQRSYNYQFAPKPGLRKQTPVTTDSSSYPAELKSRSYSRAESSIKNSIPYLNNESLLCSPTCQSQAGEGDPEKPVRAVRVTLRHTHCVELGPSPGTDRGMLKGQGGLARLPPPHPKPKATLRTGVG